MSGTDVGNDEADEGGSSARYAHKYAVVVGTVLSSPPPPPPSSSSLLVPPLSSHHSRRLRAVDSLLPHGSTTDIAGPGVVATAASCEATIHSGSDRIPSKPLRSSSLERSKQQLQQLQQQQQQRQPSKQQPSKAASAASSAASASASSSAGSARWCGHHDRFFNSDHHSAKDADVAKGKRGGFSPVIEVAPGIQLRLRGSQETWEAIARDFYVPSLCWGCSETIFVIQDAAYVLCPACRTVSPMEGTFESPETAGVGLGFTFDELVMWQQQIADERNRDLCN
jgi:hypothetical protein